LIDVVVEDEALKNKFSARRAIARKQINGGELVCALCLSMPGLSTRTNCGIVVSISLSAAAAMTILSVSFMSTKSPLSLNERKMRCDA
jgi:hypothetical protein